MAPDPDFAALQSAPRFQALVARLACGLDLYEYQGKELFRPLRDPRLGGAARDHAGGGARGGRGARRPGRRQGAGADRRARARRAGSSSPRALTRRRRRRAEILGLDIRGHVVRKLWIEQASEIAKEYYLSVTFDRGAKQPLFMFTTQGGVDIEEVAASSPEALVRLHVDPFEGFQPWQARRLIYGAGIDDPEEQKQIAAIVGKLYEAFVEFDAMLCEINPLIVTPEGEVKALDSKFTVDDNALYRHPDIAEMRDPEAVPARGARGAREGRHLREARRRRSASSATAPGSSMSTLDVIALAGGRPANFCDLGGGGDAQGVVDALEVITGDPQVQVDPLQHLRRDHALRRGRARDPRRRSSR